MRQYSLLMAMVFLVIGCSRFSQRVAPTTTHVLIGIPSNAHTTPSMSNEYRITDQIINNDLPAMRFLISPDANSIALCTYKEAMIWNINLKNGHRQRISEEWGCNKLYAWRPKSQEIFYLRETPAGVRFWMKT